MSAAHSNHVRILNETASRSVPLTVCLEITKRCNFACQHCYIPDLNTPEVLSTERILHLLEELVAAGTLFLTLTGGEVFMNRDWLLIARRARRLGFALRLFSNGSTITEAIADHIKELGAAVEISLYCMDEQVFETITQRPGSFKRCLRGIERLRERDIEVFLKAPMMTLNYRLLEPVFAYAAAVGAKVQAFPTIMAKRNGDQSTIDLRVPLEELAAYYGSELSGCADPAAFGSAVNDGPMCAAATRLCSITGSGDVLACNILPGSDRNILNMSFHDAWFGSPWLNEVRSIRRKDLATCGSCEKSPYCGRCHAKALVEDGSIYGPSSHACQTADLLERTWSGARQLPMLPASARPAPSAPQAAALPSPAG